MTLTQPPVPLVDGITAATIGVGDFAPMLALFCDQLGFAESAAGTIGAADAERLWGVAAEIEVRVLSAAGAPTGRVHLLKVDPTGSPSGAPRTVDLGFGGVNLYSRDIAVTYAALSAAGYRWPGPPTTYDVQVGRSTVRLTEGVCHGPDGLSVVFVQPDNVRSAAAWDADPTRLYTELTSVVCQVPDLDAEKAFWTADGLGLDCWYDVPIQSPELDTMAGLPPGTTMRLAFLAGASGRTARLELITLPPTAVSDDRRDQQRPGHDAGHTGWCVQTGDVAAAVDRALAQGGALRCAPFELDSPLHGVARVAGVHTPGGLAVDLYQPLS